MSEDELFDGVDDGDDAVDFSASPLRLTIDLQALVDNWREMRRLSGTTRMAAVVKGDAYGLGIEDCGSALYQAGARDFFVATPAEGAALRPFTPEARIYVLSGLWAGVEKLILSNDLVPVLASEEQLAFFMSVIAEVGPWPCALQVDTGFNRLGFSVQEALDLADDSTRPSNFDPVLVMSHLACGDQPDHAMNRAQLESFQAVAEAFEGVESSLAASAGIRLGKAYHFDLTRCGISLYGAACGGPDTRLRTVATAEARILQIRQAKAGETVSYGATQSLERDTLIAVVAAGYADGYPRGASGTGVRQRAHGSKGGIGFVRGKRVPILGRVTMDMMMFDVTDVPGIRTGDYVELFGPNISVDEVAAAAGIIGYELLTSLGLRYQRDYLPALD